MCGGLGGSGGFEGGVQRRNSVRNETRWRINKELDRMDIVVWGDMMGGSSSSSSRRTSI